MLQGGLSGGCGLAVQALVAAVAVGELALCSPQPAASQSHSASRCAACRSVPGAAASSNGAAVEGEASGQAADAAAAAAAAASSEPADPVILMRLMGCSLALGLHADRMTHETAEARASELAEIEADDLAAGKGKSAAAGSKQRRAQHRAVKAEVQAAQAASARLLATTVAGLAGLTAAVAAAERAEKAQRSAGATGQQRDEAAVELRVMGRRTMWALLRQSAELAVLTLEAASRMSDFAADFIEVPQPPVLHGCCLCVGCSGHTS